MIKTSKSKDSKDGRKYQPRTMVTARCPVDGKIHAAEVLSQAEDQYNVRFPREFGNIVIHRSSIFGAFGEYNSPSPF